MTARELLDVGRGFRETGLPFARELVRLSDRLGLDPSYIAAVIAFESSFNPAAKNPGSSASGLIQFIESTAQSLGTTTAALRRMSAVEQLPYVERYYQRIGPSRLHTPGDYYLAVFSPSFIGRSDSTHMYESGQSAYEANRALDRDQKGYIAVGDATAPVRNLLAAALGRPRYAVELGGEVPPAAPPLADPAPCSSPEPAGMADSSSASSAPRPLTSGGTVVHVVVTGDTAYGIARRYTGDGARFIELRAPNPHIRNLGRLRAGDRLTLPEDWTP